MNRLHRMSMRLCLWGATTVGVQADGIDPFEGYTVQIIAIDGKSVVSEEGDDETPSIDAPAPQRDENLESAALSVRPGESTCGEDEALAGDATHDAGAAGDVAEIPTPAATATATLVVQDDLMVRGPGTYRGVYFPNYHSWENWIMNPEFRRNCSVTTPPPPSPAPLAGSHEADLTPPIPRTPVRR